MRRVLVAGAAVAAALVPPATAFARPGLQSLDASPAARPFATGPVDPVLHGASSARAASVAGRASAREHVYRTRKGRVPIRVTVSRSFRGVTRAKVQSFVDFFGTLLHHGELRRLNVQIRTRSELATTCGPDALACYDPGSRTMFIPGQETPSGQAPLAFVIAHEYGHHIANFRSNYPFPAILFGPKRWATAEQVCPRVLAHRAFPGDEGKHYRADPGEAWAESYARYRYRRFPWEFASFFEPNSRIYPLIRQDVTHPFGGLRRRRFFVRFGPGNPPLRHYTIETPLDGIVSVRLRHSPRLRLLARLYVNGKQFAPTRRRPLSGVVVCGQRRFDFFLGAKSGKGLVRVAIARS